MIFVPELTMSAFNLLTNSLMLGVILYLVIGWRRERMKADEDAAVRRARGYIDRTNYQSAGRP